ncbi:hypothetical protein NW755_004935 [Fusarium falciforme]|uniref:Uncharacterized protein n=1 Tax=Fusarium falciforme TaxID=195108 RepID=A0A9W8RA43_9HYPO|nr:hypothetical protein NW755_004935 [Fusarium falciforme]
MYGWMSEALSDWLPGNIPAKHIATQPLFLCTCSNMTVLLGPDQTLRDLDAPSIPYPHVSYIMPHPYTGQPCLVSHRHCFLTSAFFHSASLASVPLTLPSLPHPQAPPAACPSTARLPCLLMAPEPPPAV